MPRWLNNVRMRNWMRGGLTQPQGTMPLACFYILNACLKPQRLWWSDHDKELLVELARLTFKFKPAVWNKYNILVSRGIFRCEAKQASVWLTAFAHSTYRYIYIYIYIKISILNVMGRHLWVPLDIISIKAASQTHVNERGVNDLSNASHLLFRQRMIIERGIIIVGE